MDDVSAGGIMKCDVIAAGIVNAAKGVGFCLLSFLWNMALLHVAGYSRLGMSLPPS